MSAKSKTLKLTQIALIAAVMVLLDITPLGMIKIPPVSITLLHIPVIIAGVLMGPSVGAIMGGVFGLISFLEATFRASSPVDLLFSPLTSTNPVGSLVMCFLPRILLGLIAGYLYLIIKRWDARRYFSIVVSALIATAAHTFMVLGCLWLFFNAVPLATVFGYIIGVNGLIEMGAAALIAVAVCKPLLKTLKQ